MRRCAFLTLEDPADFFIYDRLLFAPLHDLGWDVEELPWTRKTVVWGEFDAVIIRSTWDYQRDPSGFLDTLERIESETILYNTAATCRWNLSKRYLQDLQQRGVTTIPTCWSPSLDKHALLKAADHLQTRRLVAKPLIGANADDTFVIDTDDLNTAAEALSVFAQQELMLQPFLGTIREEGEYSLFYFGGEYSHAIRKRPKPGDFRVQEEHGGLIESVTAPPDVALFAETALRAVGEVLLYARVDVVRLAGGRPALIEMELIEPSLYFEQCASAPGHFVRVFERMHAARMSQQ